MCSFCGDLSRPVYAYDLCRPLHTRLQRAKRLGRVDVDFTTPVRAPSIGPTFCTCGPDRVYERIGALTVQCARCFRAVFDVVDGKVVQINTPPPGAKVI